MGNVMADELADRCKLVLKSLGLCCPEDVSLVAPLTGGVSSDIAVVTFGSKTVVVKFALKKLKVDADWFSPTHRNKAEFFWLREVREIEPACVPETYGWSKEENGFVMEFITGPDTYNWKAALLSGDPDQGEARAVAQTLGRIHSASAATGFDRSPFENAAVFDTIRIDPYLRYTAKQNPDLADKLYGLADALFVSDAVLIHGDISPKNIIINGGHPVILDAECTTMGDPAFDVAFCMNHLLLKSVHMPHLQDQLSTAAGEFWQAYKPFVNWEDPQFLEKRVAALLPALMLARIDGKSPVEYLSPAARKMVKAIARPLIAKPAFTINEVIHAVKSGAFT